MPICNAVLPCHSLSKHPFLNASAGTYVKGQALTLYLDYGPVLVFVEGGSVEWCEGAIAAVLYIYAGVCRRL